MRQLQEDGMSTELFARDIDTSDSYDLSSSAASAPAPSFTSAMPGYLYTTSSNDASAPQYVYTAVPVGPVVASIPQ